MLLADFRRATGFTVFPALFATGAFEIFSRGMPWRGEWAWSLEEVVGSTILIAMLVAGATAFDVARSRGQATRLLLGSTPRGPWAMTRTILANSWWGFAAVMVLAILVLTMTATTGAQGSIPVWVLLGVAAHLLGSSALGALIGRFLPALIAAPVAAVLPWLLYGISISFELPPLFQWVSPSAVMAGKTRSWDYMVWIILGMLGLTAFIAAAIALRDSPVRKFGVAAVAIIGFASLVTSIIRVSDPDFARIVVIGQPVEFVCEGHHPEVCLPATNVRKSAWLAREVQKAADVLESHGVSIPERFTMIVPGQEVASGSGVFSFSPEDVNSPQGPEGVGAEVLSQPADCPEYYADNAPLGFAFEAQARIAMWIRLQLGQTSLQELRSGEESRWVYSAEDSEWFATATGSSQVDWVARTYEQLTRCDLQSIKLSE
jgi:hypothetical protein